MKQTLTTPNFENEKNEAEWYDSHSDEILAQFENAAADGSLRRGTLRRRGITPKTSIRIDPADIVLAKQQAEQRGLPYQTYLKMIIHEHLQQAATATSSKR